MSRRKIWAQSCLSENTWCLGQLSGLAQRSSDYLWYCKWTLQNNEQNCFVKSFSFNHLMETLRVKLPKAQPCSRFDPVLSDRLLRNYWPTILWQLRSIPPWGSALANQQQSSPQLRFYCPASSWRWLNPRDHFVQKHHQQGFLIACQEMAWFSF